jgi:hypothetical protein
LTKRRVGSAVDGHDQGSAVDIESDVGLVSSIRWDDVADRVERYSPSDVARVYQATNAHTNFFEWPRSTIYGPMFPHRVNRLSMPQCQKRRLLLADFVAEVGDDKSWRAGTNFLS